MSNLRLPVNSLRLIPPLNPFISEKDLELLWNTLALKLNFLLLSNKSITNALLLELLKSLPLLTLVFKNENVEYSFKAV